MGAVTLEVDGDDIQDQSHERRSAHEGVDSNILFAVMILWEGNDDIMLHTLAYLDVITLVEKKPVSQRWNRLCTITIDLKAAKGVTRFQTREELSLEVNRYVRYERKDAEKFACTYGWPMNNWDVSKIKDFSKMFRWHQEWNEDIGRWNMSNATNLESMFDHAKSFNKDVSTWDTRNVTTMHNMFFSAHAFNQDISSWNTGNVTLMNDMFMYAESFNKDVSRWNTANVITMKSMFESAIAFNQDLSSWDTRNVDNMDRMFSNAESFNGGISSWDISNVYTMHSMFSGAFVFNQDLSAWNLENREVTVRFKATHRWIRVITDMFDGAISFNRDISLWDPENLTMGRRPCENNEEWRVVAREIQSYREK